MKHPCKSLATLVLLSLCTTALPAYASELPGYYDWRLIEPTVRNSTATDAIVGEIRDQNPYGTCWAFGATASLESTLNLQLQQAGLPPTQRLSERYLAWLTYAQPVNGGGDGYVLFPADQSHVPTSPIEVYFSGGENYSPVSVYVRYGAAYDTEWPYTSEHTKETMGGVDLVANRGTALHDVYNLNFYYATTSVLKTDINYYKNLIQKYGLLTAGYHTESSAIKDICNPDFYFPNHVISLVGWDDNYEIKDKYGVTHTGAWLMRNSWGTDAGYNGYYYISYDEGSLQAGSIFQAESDWGRYTSVDTVAPAGMDAKCIGNEELYKVQTSYKTADKFTSSASKLLKAVGFYVPADNMSYKVDVSLKGSTPADTQTIYSKSGTFGQDGLAMYKGYRTIDFDKFIYLPNQQNYIITVTLTGIDGTSYYVPLAGNQEIDPAVRVASGVSFIYDAASGTWVDTKNTTSLAVAGLKTYTDLAIPMFALGKYSQEANGGDFTVVSLNDNGVGGSEIYLGKKDELYTTDLLHPALPDFPNSYRYTLSNMTVELTKGLTDSVYGGVISGEGGVTKTGTGMLALTGTNTYTGGTNVNAGSMALTGSLQSPVTLASGATLTGTGTINGNLTSKGTLVPGLNREAQSLLGNTNPIGTLTVKGNLNSTGELQLAVDGTNNSKLDVSGASGIVGTKLSLIDGYNRPLANYNYTYLTSPGGITGNSTIASKTLSPYLTLTSTINGTNGILTAKETTALGGLPGMSESENSVGRSLSGYLANAIAAKSSSSTVQALNNLFYQDAAASRASIKQITNVTRAQLIAVSPLTAMTSGAVYNRLDTALYDGNVKVAVPTASFDGVPATMQVAAPMTLDTTNNLWFKLLRGFESYGGTDGGYDLDNKSFGGVIGYDRAVNGTTRVGGLLSYAKTDYSTDVMSGDSHDWRIGIYASHDTGTWKTQGLISYGQNRYDFNRYIAYDNSKLSSDYTAKVFDIDLKVKYLPQYNRAKSWQVAPYVGLAYTHSTQGAYAEDGSSIFAQNIDSSSNNSYRAEVGVEWKHDMTKDSSFGGSVGYKRVLSGVNPELNGTFVGDDNRFTLKTDNDRNYFTYSLNLKKNTGHNWTVQGDVRGEKSSHNHREVYSVMAKYAF